MTIKKSVNFTIVDFVFKGDLCRKHRIELVGSIPLNHIRAKATQYLKDNASSFGYSIKDNAIGIAIIDSVSIVKRDYQFDLDVNNFISERIVSQRGGDNQ